MSALDRCFNVADLRLSAKRRLPRGVFEFVDRGTEDEVGLRHNRAAIEDIKLLPRVLNDTSSRSPRTELFGKPVTLPLVIAPTGAAGLVWHEGELALARAAATMGVPFTLATGAMTSMEKIAREAGGRLWFQLYLWKERALSYELVDRARANGFEALVVTVDTTVPPNREYNARNGFGLPFHPTARSVIDVATHPDWFARVLLKYLTTSGMPRFENHPEGLRTRITGNAHAAETMRQDTLSWDDIGHLRDRWPGILMVKGVMRGDDALRAVGMGVDGIVVSNHGGRNLDSAAASITALPDVAQAVGDRATVILDSGVRRGSDIFKALALGAKAVLTGRATLYGTAVGGQAGAARALAILRNEFDKTMAYCGVCHVDEITSDLLAGARDRINALPV
jgi:isopentenyl diphosphate isomerase/L-lactate dehydrogenase-like FMN-dependent dehydrogenase